MRGMAHVPDHGQPAALESWTAIGSIAVHAGISKSRARKLLRTLEAAGVVERSRHGSDRWRLSAQSKANR